MVRESVDLPTDVLLDLVIGILDVGQLLTSKDVAELEELNTSYSGDWKLKAGSVRPSVLSITYA